ncbi:hypothetical protein AMTRI_Chr05g69990 [Amborella trichopoda]
MAAPACVLELVFSCMQHLALLLSFCLIFFCFFLGLIGLGSPMMRLSMKNRMTNGGFMYAFIWIATQFYSLLVLMCHNYWSLRLKFICRAQTDLQVISKLHMILRPFLLRRVKENVEQNLPKKKEIILYANMTEHQKNIQNHLINKTLEGYLIEKAFHAKGFRAKLSNLMIQLRKNCNHPDLLESAFDNDGIADICKFVIAHTHLCSPEIWSTANNIY